jgi:nucleoside triphosphatase
MPIDRGVYPGQWALPGGGVEPGEQLEEALRREILEELGVSLTSARPLFFTDRLREKTFPGGKLQLLYMVFLLYECTVSDDSIRLSDEFTEYAWVLPTALLEYDLNEATSQTFRKMGLI